LDFLSSRAVVVDLDAMQGSSNFATLLTGGVSLTGHAHLVGNSSDVQQHGYIDPHIYLLNLENVRASFLAFTATGSVSIGYSNGVFQLSVQPWQRLTLSFLGVVNVDVYGYVRSDGQFSFTGEASIGFNIPHTDIGGSVHGSLTFSNY